MSKCRTCPRKLITLQSEYIHIILASPMPSSLARGFWRERQGSCCCLGGWDLVSMWLYSVKPARKGRWTLTVAEVASGGGDEVERIADWQLSSITCPTSQMQVDRKGHVGLNGDSYTVYRGCLFASQSLVECCLPLIHPTIYQSIPFPGSSLYVTCSISQRCFRAVALLHWYFSEPTGCICLRKKTHIRVCTQKQIITMTYLSLRFWWRKTLRSL